MTGVQACLLRPPGCMLPTHETLSTPSRARRPRNSPHVQRRALDDAAAHRRLCCRPCSRAPAAVALRRARRQHTVLFATGEFIINSSGSGGANARARLRGAFSCPGPLKQAAPVPPRTCNATRLTQRSHGSAASAAAGGCVAPLSQCCAPTLFHTWQHTTTCADGGSGAIGVQRTLVPAGGSESHTCGPGRRVRVRAAQPIRAAEQAPDAHTCSILVAAKQRAQPEATGGTTPRTSSTSDAAAATGRLWARRGQQQWPQLRGASAQEPFRRAATAGRCCPAAQRAAAAVRAPTLTTHARAPPPALPRAGACCGCSSRQGWTAACLKAGCQPCVPRCGACGVIAASARAAATSSSSTACAVAPTRRAEQQQRRSVARAAALQVDACLWSWLRWGAARHQLVAHATHRAPCTPLVRPRRMQLSPFPTLCCPAHQSVHTRTCHHCRPTAAAAAAAAPAAAAAAAGGASFKGDLLNTSYYPTRADAANVSKRWYIIDAQGQTLGRLATLAATYIRCVARWCVRDCVCGRPPSCRPIPFCDTPLATPQHRHAAPHAPAHASQGQAHGHVQPQHGHGCVRDCDQRGQGHCHGRQGGEQDVLSPRQWAAGLVQD